MSKKITTRIQQKHDIETNWNKATAFVPYAGELIVYDVDSTYTYERFKIGDGKTTVDKLPFVINPHTHDDRYYTESEIDLKLATKASTNHASTGTSYGVSTASNYGHAKASSTTPKANGTATLGTETSSFARGDHVHPTDTTRAASDHTHGNITKAGELGTASRVVVTDSNKKVTVSSSITTTELDYLAGVTSNIQTQLNGKAATSHGTHVSYGTSATAISSTASAGSATTVSRSDHTHSLSKSAVTTALGTSTGKANYLREDGNWATPPDTKVTAVGNHYNPTEDTNAALSVDACGATTAASWGSTNLVTGVNLQRDAKGHVTGVTVDSIKMPANPDTKVTVDSALSSTSTNPVQNKVVNTAFSSKVDKTTTINGKALSGDITLDSTDIGAAHKVNVTNTAPAGTSYYPLYSTDNSGEQTVNACSDLYYTGASTWSSFNVGKTTGNGILTLHRGTYNGSGVYGNLQTATLTANRSYTFPNVSGTVLTTGNPPVVAQIITW